MKSEGLGSDFLEHLRQEADAAAAVFTLLDDPADLARASAVSRSWRRFVIRNLFSKIQCLRVCPDISNFTRTEVISTTDVDVDEDDTGSNAPGGWENRERDHGVYMHLSHALLSPYTSKNCIIDCIGASSTDNFPQESIETTLEPDLVRWRPSYWSSGGQRDPDVPEFLIYGLCSDLCLVDEIKIKPLKAYFQSGHPIYSAKYVRLRMGYPKSPLVPERLVSDENKGQLTADGNYIWTYTSPEFPMLQENVLQSFKLPRPVLCIGGVVKIEFLGRIQKQATDDLYYICMSRVQVQGNPLSRELGVAPCEDGVVLSLCRSDSSRYDGRDPSTKWDNFGAARRKAVLNWMLGPASKFVDEDD